MAKAIVKAGTKRAVFAIEDEIADTRKRIERTAKADLTKQAQNALAKPAERIDVGAEMNKLAERIRAETRGTEIASAESNAARWAKREQDAKAMLRGIKVNDYGWGAVFEGTKKALVRAGLVSAKLIPRKGKEKEYALPLNHDDGYRAAVYGPTYGAIPENWSAKSSHAESGRLAVYVEFNSRDREVRERAQLAIAELDRADMNPALLRVLILGIPPVPLSVTVPEQIKAAKKYPTQAQVCAHISKGCK